MVINEKYRSPLRLTLIMQVALLLASAVLLDGGECARFVTVGCLAYWIGMAFVLIRRRLTPSRTDLVYAAAGFPVIILIAAVLFVAMRRVF